MAEPSPPNGRINSRMNGRATGRLNGRSKRLSLTDSPGTNRAGTWHRVLSVSASSVGLSDPPAASSPEKPDQADDSPARFEYSPPNEPNGTPARDNVAPPMTFIAPAPPPARAAVDRSLARLQALFVRLDDHREQADRASHQLQERLRVAADLLRALHGQSERVAASRDTVDALERRAASAITRMHNATAQLEAIEHRITRRLGDLDTIHERLARAEDRACRIEHSIERAEVNAAAQAARRPE